MGGPARKAHDQQHRQVVPSRSNPDKQGRDQCQGQHDRVHVEDDYRGGLGRREKLHRRPRSGVEDAGQDHRQHWQADDGHPRPHDHQRPEKTDRGRGPARRIDAFPQHQPGSDGAKDRDQERERRHVSDRDVDEPVIHAQHRTEGECGAREMHRQTPRPELRDPAAGEYRCDQEDADQRAHEHDLDCREGVRQDAHADQKDGKRQRGERHPERAAPDHGASETAVSGVG